MTDHALNLRGVTREHGSGDALVHALRGIDLTLAPGELVAVMGPSGSGKSTLLNLAGGLDAPTAGSIHIDGTSIVGLSATRLAALRRSSVGYVFQDYNLVPTLTAVENVSLPLELEGMRARAAREAGLEALERIGLPEVADRFPDEMSGGQRQRVAIARALVGERRLVLADEPTGALDTTTGEFVLDQLRAACDAGASGLLVTHEARYAAWADRILYLRDGREVTAQGTTR